MAINPAIKYLILSLFLWTVFALKSQENLYNRASKISPLLVNLKNGKTTKNVRIVINDSVMFKNWAGEYFKKQKIRKKGNKIYEIDNLTFSELNLLKNCKWLEFIDVSDRRAFEERTIDNLDLSYNKINQVHSYFPQINGDGLVVSIKERLFDTTDIDFSGRIINSGMAFETQTLHATFMASFIAGAGNSSPKGKGVAWKANLASSSFTNLLPDNLQALKNLGISVQNHSYGVNQVENYYGIETKEYDRQCNDYPEMVHVFSSGNLGADTSKTGKYAGVPGFANLTGQFKMSKNTLAVGAVDKSGKISPLSSKGPAYDGRIKPELVALGEGGTSDAAAIVSGICLLVQDAYKKLNNGELPPSSLVKSVLINSADEVGADGIDFESGYGLVDAYGAVKTINENRFFISSLSTGEEKIFEINVPAGEAKLKVTLVWNDPDAELNTDSALVNDLDMEVKHPSSGNEWKPWVLNDYPDVDSLKQAPKRAQDHLNNVEQVSIEFPEPGVYEIHVNGNGVRKETQAFSLSYGYESGFEWIYPLKNNQLLSQVPVDIRWQDYQGNEEVSLEYQQIGTNTWNLIADEIEISRNYYEWIPPELNSPVLIRMKTLSQEFTTDTFVVSKPIFMDVAYNCEDETLLRWNNQFNAGLYKVYKLGTKYLEEIETTADTFKILDAVAKKDYFYSVSPVIDGYEGFASNTINYSQAGVGCYIISFLPESIVTDTVWMELKLASDYHLASFRLERLSGNGFETIQNYEPVPGLITELFDFKPFPNRNVYRVCLEREDHELFYSDEVEIFYSPENNLFVYPNPVATGSDLNIITGDETGIQCTLYESSGRLLYGEYLEPGAIRAFRIREIPTGYYILEIKEDSGKKSAKTIVVTDRK
ncbi:MAG: S8 family serine peptidase [Bacteroidales bacterium]